MSKVDRAVEWKKRIQQAKEYPGSYAAYCRETGVRDHLLYYWRKKLESDPAVKPASLSARSAFIPIQVQTEAPAAEARLGLASEVNSTLPDPRWVAEFVRQLFCGNPS